MTNSKADEGSSAKADDDGDWLGYGAYADALWSRTLRALDKDKNGKQALGDDPLVIGIFGEWGAGKSHLLKLVYRLAQDQSALDIADRVLRASTHVEGELPLTVTVPVMFQPWKYEHEPHLHVPLAIHVADALEDAWKTLPSDFEKVKVWAERAGKDAKDVGEKLEAAKVWINKLGKFWDGTKAVVKSDAADVVAGTLDVMATAMLVPPVLSLGLSKVRAQLGDSDETIDGDVAPAPKRPWFSAKPEIAKKSSGDRKKQEFSHSTDGLAFYRIEKLIRAMTRPKLDAKMLAAAGLKIGDGIEFDLRINFVVFVDDLDRCLPEKAVEMLELIKTIFNVESFAFVLALDDEVIERGIGHRYKDYHLQGKKPEMPITGFEYLEKIIHLPFRLPALTPEQAGAFVRKYEAQIEPDPTLRWFDKLVQTPSGALDGLGDPEKTQSRAGSVAVPPTDLLQLALSGFDAFMPRKLIRLVELLHQVAAIARLRHRPLQLSYSGNVDVRVVLVLLLIQLFQPELFRMLRRRGDSYPTLLAAFALRPVLGTPTAPQMPDLPNAQMADIDLWRWAVNPKDTAVEWKPSPAESLHSYAANCIAQAYKDKPDDRTSRTSAQQVRLPIVLQLVEHRAAQRHVFDVLKLTKRLADEMGRTGSAPHELNFEVYRSLLAQPIVLLPEISVSAALHEAGDVMTAAVTVGSVILEVPNLSPAHPKPTFPLGNIEELAQLLVSPETEAQANMASRLELRAGHVLDDRSAANLISSLNVKVTQGTVAEQQSNKVCTLNGLQYLAPFLSTMHARALWQLISDCVDINKPTDPKLRALWGDVRHALGCDDRFDAQNLYLLKDRFTGNSEQDEPLTGFVRVPAGQFTMGGKEDKDDNPPELRTIDKPFYISRTLVTVDQYSMFIRDKGYADSSIWWDKQGIDWRNGSFDSKVKNDDYKKHLARRTVALRSQPMQWDEQKALGSRPVWGVNWFEARAYARWLNAQLEPKLIKTLGAGYAAMLPTELLWERAARAASLAQADGRIWPWDSQKFNAEQHANLNRTIGGVCAVGLFPPNPVGLCDMAGNTWEWMDNLYQSNTRDFRRIEIDRALASDESLEKSDRPTLRGGSWFLDPDFARCSYRSRLPHGYWDGDVGFRVVLSLAN
jgi:formylglycine-generating enzyme required for sulfatase activity